MANTIIAQVNSTAYNLVLKGMLSHTVPAISVEKTAANDHAILLDARSPAEFAVSHIAGARFVDFDNFDLASLDDISKSDTLIVYCSVGYRSEKIAERLLAAGFDHIYNLYGGIFEWKNQGHPVVDATGEATDFVHAYSKLWGVWLQKGKKVYD